MIGVESFQTFLNIYKIGSLLANLTLLKKAPRSIWTFVSMSPVSTASSVVITVLIFIIQFNPILQVPCNPGPPFLLRNCCTILDLCLKSEIMDGFWSSRCLNDHIDMPDKIG